MPAGQGVHACCPVTFAYCPLPQLMHAVIPDAAPYWPSGHAGHTPRPGESAYSPGQAKTTATTFGNAPQDPNRCHVDRCTTVDTSQHPVTAPAVQLLQGVVPPGLNCPTVPACTHGERL